MAVWTQITANWQTSLKALMARFPYADEGQLTLHKDKPDALMRHLAQSHHLTEAEAREEMADWAFVQALARDASAAGIYEDLLFNTR